MNGAHNLGRWNVENITSNSHIKLSEPKKKGDSWCEGDFKDILPNHLLIDLNLRHETNQEFREHGIINQLYLIPNVSTTRHILNFKTLLNITL